MYKKDMSFTGFKIVAQDYFPNYSTWKISMKRSKQQLNIQMLINLFLEQKHRAIKNFVYKRF